MGVMKPLVPEEVPEQYRDLIDYSNQWTDKSASGKTRAWINARCLGCDEYRPVSINQIRNFLRGQRISRHGNASKTFPSSHRQCFYSGRVVTQHGYVWIYSKDHPRAYEGKYVPEHILVMEGHLGRYLNPDEESVHHIDGDRANNSLDNLQLRKKFHGKGQKWECRTCGGHDIVAVEL